MINWFYHFHLQKCEDREVCEDIYLQFPLYRPDRLRQKQEVPSLFFRLYFHLPVPPHEVHADFDWRINRIAAKYNKTPKEARDIITKTDKSRASYYNYYTNKKWGSAKSYNLCIDSSKYGIDNTVKAIVESIKIFDSTKASR